MRVCVCEGEGVRGVSLETGVDFEDSLVETGCPGKKKKTI